MLQKDIVVPHQDVRSTDTCPTDVTFLIILPPAPSHSCQLLSVIDSKTESDFSGWVYALDPPLGWEVGCGGV
jgi:hypothetical protein